jgi:hypothetical protein
MIEKKIYLWQCFGGHVGSSILTEKSEVEASLLFGGSAMKLSDRTNSVEKGPRLI